MVRNEETPALAAGTEEEQRAKELAAIHERHGTDGIIAFHSSFGWLVFQRPSLEVYEDFLNASLSEKTNKAAALRSLVQQCVVEPDLGTLQNIIKKRAGLPAAIGPRLVELATEELVEAGKKE